MNNLREILPEDQRQKLDDYAERAEAAAWSFWSSLTPGNAWQRPFARLAPRFCL